MYCCLLRVRSGSAEATTPCAPPGDAWIAVIHHRSSTSCTSGSFLRSARLARLSSVECSVTLPLAPDSLPIMRSMSDRRGWDMRPGLRVSCTLSMAIMCSTTDIRGCERRFDPPAALCRLEPATTHELEEYWIACVRSERRRAGGPASACIVVGRARVC
eukprot:6059095-Prymnesium_polylepis.2